MCVKNAFCHTAICSGDASNQALDKHLLRARSSEPAPPGSELQTGAKVQPGSREVELLCTPTFKQTPPAPSVWPLRLLHRYRQQALGKRCSFNQERWVQLPQRERRRFPRLCLSTTNPLPAVPRGGAGGLLRVSWSAAHRMLTLIMFTPPRDEGA